MLMIAEASQMLSTQNEAKREIAKRAGEWVSGVEKPFLVHDVVSSPSKWELNGLN